ncbi:MAG: hypothetical protein LBH94_03235 [Deltaproteobacteria bacterium]|jgi:hypothetical protein|nr:hypothetical protein [Deltaproteobacteria bacterium]
MTGISGMNIGGFVSGGMQKVDGMSAALDAKVKDITSKGGEMKQEDLLMLQYEMGRYQAFMTAMSNTVSSIQGHMKEMANSIR